MAKRRLTVEEVEAALRLRHIWEKKRQALGLTQEKVAHQCGWTTQGAFGNYLHGRSPLNIDAVLRLAKVLEVTHDAIWPGLLDVKVEKPPQVTVVAKSGAAYRVDAHSLRLLQAIQSLSPDKRAAVELLIGIKGDREQEP